MAAGVTGKSQIDQATRKFLAESRYTLQERPGVIAASIRTENLPKNQGPSVNIPKYGQVSTYALTEGVDMAQSQQITDTLMTLTPTEYGAQVVLTDLMMMTVKDEFFRVAGRILADSFDRQREETLADDFDNFSIQNPSATGTALTLGHVIANEARLRGAGYAADGTASRGGEPAPDPHTLIITPAVQNDLEKTLSGGIGAAAATQITPDQSKLNQGNEFMVAGTRVKTSVNINKDSADDAKCAQFSKESTILVSLGGGPDAERERDASLRGWEINFVGRWARGEYNDAWGIEVLADSSLPTS